MFESTSPGQLETRSSHPTSFCAITCLKKSGLSFGVRFCVVKSTKMIPNRFSYPSVHSKLSGAIVPAEDASLLRDIDRLHLPQIGDQSRGPSSASGAIVSQGLNIWG
jgi:hypothetical protein